MRIALVIDTIAPFFSGGYEQRAWEIARRLARSHDVTVFTCIDADVELDGVRFKSIMGGVDTFGSDGFRRPQEALRFASWLLKRLDLHGYDVVDCNATPFLHVPACWLKAKLANVPLVVTSHEALRDQLAAYTAQRQLPRAVQPFATHGLRIAYKLAHKLPKTLIAPCELTLSGLRAEVSKPIFVTHGGVKETHAPKRSFDGSILTVSRLAAHKRLDVLLRAFAEALHADLASRMLVVGEGPERSRLEQIAQSLRLRHHVEFVGRLSDPELDELLTKSSGVHVSASLREGLSLATLGALAAGIPAVVSARPDAVNGSLEYMRDGVNGAVCDGTPPGLLDAVSRIIRHPGGYAACSVGAVATAERYRWDIATHEIVQAYAATIGAWK